VIARRTEKHLAQAADKRVERWRSLAHEAAKQSRRADVPIIEEPITLACTLALDSIQRMHILLAEDERNTTLRQRIEARLQSTVLRLAQLRIRHRPRRRMDHGRTRALRENINWQSASLGPRILRAETAAITALAIASSLALINPPCQSNVAVDSSLLGWEL
jgi:16S rRNA (uracil1498-N3)-methyltransferase